MAYRKICTEGNKILTKVCRPVKDFNMRLHILLDDMTDTLMYADGAGLAAPQVGVMRRACLVRDLSKEDRPVEEQILELINPEIIEEDGEQTGIEGCLSIPDVWGIVTRPQKVKVRAQNRNGEFFEVEGEGILARALCHEIDHLDGHLFREKSEKILTPDELRAYLAKERQDAESTGEKTETGE
ncbi:MAG: peptide deformylase [Oscillospiraceae bacterium]|nr:peptide deformylase [Oscillospiraceae bacterium]